MDSSSLVTVLYNKVVPFFILKIQLTVLLYDIYLLNTIPAIVVAFGFAFIFFPISVPQFLHHLLPNI